MEQIIFVDKPSGMTSFGAVARVRRILSEQAYGHVRPIRYWAIDSIGRQGHEKGARANEAR